MKTNAVKYPKYVSLSIESLFKNFWIEKQNKQWNGVDLYTYSSNFGMIVFNHERAWWFSFVFCLDKNDKRWNRFMSFIHNDCIFPKCTYDHSLFLTKNTIGASHKFEKSMSENYHDKLCNLVFKMKNRNSEIVALNRLKDVLRVNMSNDDRL